ncbi:MAG: 30S ribosomal protein S16 [Rhodospirillaceae bacterium]|jgi:small subunit ribosomal protein S16|nr:30S ribosomal protein S16 [Rhodospirillaceae bacterium]
MSLKIRLSRGGAKKRPFYKIVLADSRSPRDGKFIERLGSYNPMLSNDHKQRLILKEARIKYWLSIGAKLTDRVTRFFADAGYISTSPRPGQSKKSQPKSKAQERLKERLAKAVTDDANVARE